MPYKSDAQRRYFNANRKELESQGVDVDEWNDSSRGKKLPEKVKEKKSFDIDSILDAAKKIPGAVDAAKDAIGGIPGAAEKALRQAKGQFAGTLIGGRAGAGALAGGAAGALMGGLGDPGYDERTGKKRSRLMNALKMGLGGATIGGVANTAFPQGEQLGGQLGGDLGGYLATKSGSAVQLLAKLAASDYDEEKKQKSEAKKDEKHQARKNLGPLEHAYVADSIGGQSLQNASRKLKEMHNDPTNPYQGIYDRLLTMQGGFGENLGERISRGSARMAESPSWRALSMLDPTASGQQEGIIGALSGFGGGEDKAEGAKRRSAEAYAKFLKKHQDKVDPKAKTTERETPFHVNSQGMLANLDSDIAGHKYMRNERPLHYWLNLLSKSGPLSELGDRGMRRIIAGQASPESTLGRFGMGAGGLTTLGLLPMLMGGEGAQQKLRASAVKNKLYAPEATPVEKAASIIALLAQEAVKQARCWKGYEPVPGKAPYSEDSCQPAGSGKKKVKKEKKANAVAQLAMAAVPSMALGSAFGGLKGLAENPGVNPETGKEKSRLVNTLTGMLSGAASGGLGSLKAAEACSCGCGKPDGECGCDDSSPIQKMARLAVKQAEGAWTREEGKSESGGLNAKGRASLKAQGQDIKPPVTESNPKGERAGRKASFCARMGGMKSKLTSKETANDPDSRINKSLRKWNC